ncbi:MAG: TonB family protein [Nitrospirota bacterium]
MKRYFIYSIILHMLIIALALVISREQKEKAPQPFYAKIITPEELDGKKTMQRPSVAPRRERPPVFPQLPKNLPLPRDLSSVPTRRAPAASSPKNAPEGYESKRSQQGGAPDVPSKDTASAERERAPQEAHLGTQKAPEAKNGIPSGKPGTSQGPSRTAREKLFDREVIGKLAQADKGEAQHGSSITFDTKEYRYYGYMQRLKDKIEGIWIYPSAAAARGIYGDLYIRFTIKKNGKLGAVEVIRTSGHKELDDAALKALRDAEPYWPLPESWEEEGLTITGHFVYTIYGTYIR